MRGEGNEKRVTSYDIWLRGQIKLQRQASVEAKRERDRQLQERALQQQLTREPHLANLEEERLRAWQCTQERIDHELKPVKERERRRWLADHPDKIVQDYERLAWPNLRQNHIGQRERERFVQLLNRMRANTGNSL
jgi:hypothetical protein